MAIKRRTIGQIASEAGVGVETVRFYERRGLIEKPARSDGGYRHYDETALAMLRYIRIAQQLGMSLKDIAEIKSHMDEQASFCGAVRTTVDRKLAALVEQMAALTNLKSELEAFLTRCRSRPSTLACPVLEELTRLDAAVGTPKTRKGASR